VVITGISPNGIGADAARVIFAHDPKLLVLASRTQKNIDSVMESLAPQGADNLKSLILDLASQAAVHKAATELLEMTTVVDVLINNAAVFMLPEYHMSTEGIELQFAVNHIGHFLFTNLIINALLKAKDGATVVNVTSRGHVRDGVSVEDYNFGVSRMLCVADSARNAKRVV
jgi:NAD(P)-dependent dehydrogenase (short-subunit alcohol dehydrogenase family)